MAKTMGEFTKKANGRIGLFQLKESGLNVSTGSTLPLNPVLGNSRDTISHQTV